MRAFFVVGFSFHLNKSQSMTAFEMLVIILVVLRVRGSMKIRTSKLEADFGFDAGPHLVMIIATVLAWLIPLV